MKLARLTPYSGQMTAAYYRGAIPHYNAYWEISHLFLLFVVIFFPPQPSHSSHESGWD